MDVNFDVTIISILVYVSAWDRRLLLNTKFKLRGFTDTRIFLCEDLAPEDRRTNNVKSKTVSGHLPSDVTDECGMHGKTIDNGPEQSC